MAMQHDQPRPDLDAAIDAVVPSLSAVSDEAATASLRRTRIALADAAPQRKSGGAWRWAMPAVAFTTVLVVVSLWWPRPRVDAPSIARAPLPSRPIARAVPSAPALVPPVRPTRDLREPREPRKPRVRATSTTPPIEAPRRDPLADIVRAVQQIPEDAWARTITRAGAPLAVADASVTSIDVTPLDTPSLDGGSSEPVAPGEP